MRGTQLGVPRTRTPHKHAMCCVKPNDWNRAIVLKKSDLLGF
jgi:hypothetical protein